MSDIPQKCCHSHHELVIEENESLSNFEPNVLKEAVHGARSDSLNNYHIQCRVCGWCRIEDYRKLSLTIELRVSRYKLRQNVRATMNWGRWLKGNWKLDRRCQNMRKRKGQEICGSFAHLDVQVKKGERSRKKEINAE